MSDLKRRFQIKVKNYLILEQFLAQYALSIDFEETCVSSATCGGSGLVFHPAKRGPGIPGLLSALLLISKIWKETAKVSKHNSACHTSCTECNGPSPTNCTVCSGSYALTLDNQCSQWCT